MLNRTKQWTAPITKMFHNSQHPFFSTKTTKETISKVVVEQKPLKNHTQTITTPELKNHQPNMGFKISEMCSFVNEQIDNEKKLKMK